MGSPRAYRQLDRIDTSAGTVSVKAVVGAGIGGRSPQAGAQGSGGPRRGHPYFDFSTVSTWRLVLAGVAFAYVVGFHLNLGVLRVNVGR